VEAAIAVRDGREPVFHVRNLEAPAQATSPAAPPDIVESVPSA